MKDFDREYEVDVPDRDEKGEIIFKAGPAPGTKVAVMKTVTVSRAENAAKERTFRIGGETFAHRPGVAPEAVMRWYKWGAGELEDAPEEELAAMFNETIMAFLEPGQEERWAAVRKSEAEHPISLTDMRGLIRWLFEETSFRPTAPPSPSSTGPVRAPTGTPSTAPSPSPAEAA